jgi:hypothetical protein
MRIMRASRFACAFLVFAVATVAWSQSTVSSPKQALGHDLGEDYYLANYKELETYWRRIEKESNRVKVVEMGKTEEGRTQLMAIVTSPENLKNLERYRDISRRLALAKDLTDEQARALAKEGKTVVWIDGGLHASEVLGAQQLMETMYRMASGEDEETMRVLNDCIILFVHANPDGMDLCSEWYMRNPDPKKRSLEGLPRLYQKYIGHDNNRDFYGVTQAETKNMSRVMYRELYPQIVYNHHQTGPAGTVLFQPPFRDPFNYLFDPLIPVGIDLVGAAMQNRFISEGKPGATIRSGAPYSTWWNGGLRTTAYFHNMIGLLTETIGSPTPMRIPFIPDRLLPKGDYPFPIEPRVWHFRESVEYSVTANKAVLDLASKHREHFLYNFYQMGRNMIRRGSQDNWTASPDRIAAVKASGATGIEEGMKALHNPALRDPRGYIIPADQPDLPTAVKFLNTLVENAIVIQRATKEFEVGGKKYAAGSYVVKCDQPFRAHILDMFEPQDHPNDLAYPGGPPVPPYDSAGWTLAFQMGVQFDRILDGFEGPFEPVDGFLKPDFGAVAGANKPSGYVLDHAYNDAFAAVTQLLNAKEKVSWLRDAVTLDGKPYPAGTIYVRSSKTAGDNVKRLAAQLGLRFTAVAQKPANLGIELKPTRIGLWDRYGGSMESGWTRWILEQFGAPFQVVFAPELDAGDLNKKFDILIFVDNAIGAGTGSGRTPNLENIPEDLRNRVGSVTAAKTVPQLKKFLEEGGTILTIGSSANLATQLGLPITNPLVEATADGRERSLPNEKFYIPGSVLRMKVNNTLPLAWGMPEYVDTMFDSSRVFKLGADAERMGIRQVAWFDTATPLRSGWALGESYLRDTATVVEAPVGKGKLILCGTEILFRAQPHGTFKFLFNAIYGSTATQGK